MTKAALIEQLAEQRYRLGFGGFNYADLPEREKERLRQAVLQEWPLIVAFVGTWLDDRDAIAMFPYELADVWREAMS